ncbi:MAG: sulfate ABC transporter substrate-binding protein [Ottowia sp.]
MRFSRRSSRRFFTFALALAAAAGAQAQPPALLNSSYDVSREFFKDINAAFVQHYKQTTGQDIRIDQSHGGSSAQARAVADGMAADVVTMNTAADVAFLAERGVVAADWQQQFPQGAAPTASTIIFLVRQGNPKNIRDWADLARPDVKVVTVNPKTSGNGRLAYLAAWGQVRAAGGSDEQAREFVAKLYKNVPALARSGRDATGLFLQRNLGDVLLTAESEALAAQREFGQGRAQAVYPAISIEAHNPVAVVQRTVDKKGTGEAARAYLQFLYSPQAQATAARHGLRPRVPAERERHASAFAPLRLFDAQEFFGPPVQAQKTHFGDGGVFDQLYQPGR